MKICILSRKPSLYSTERLKEAGESRGHEVQVVNTLKCFMNSSSNSPAVHYKKEVLNRFDAVIPRIGASITFYGTAILRQFEMMGVYALNESLAISRSRDKLRAHQIFSQKGVGMPITGFAHAPSNTDSLVDMVGGAPLILKLLEGTQGKGVILAETKKAAQSLIEAFRGLDTFFLVQEFIKEAGGADIRCFVIGDKVIAAMKRQGEEGEFRSNLHCGGTASIVKISPAERKTAILATKAMGLRVAGVDIIRSKRGPLVLEVNSSPGLKGIESSTKIDVAGKIIEFMESDVKVGKNSRINKG
jgi:ribosomal protein S6--L-glutamate ligase